MVTIRHLGDCPCPRCKIPLQRCHLTGTESDKNDRIVLRRHDDDDYKNTISSVRRKIYEDNYKVTSAWVERKLRAESLVPTLVNYCFCVMQQAEVVTIQNTFSDKLSRHGLDIFTLFPVDLLHEVELGVWKGLFIHLLRILESHNANLILELNQRYGILVQKVLISQDEYTC
jgi:hypothetical protein